MLKSLKPFVLVSVFCLASELLAGFQAGGTNPYPQKKQAIERLLHESQTQTGDLGAPQNDDKGTLEGRPVEAPSKEEVIDDDAIVAALQSVNPQPMPLSEPYNHRKGYRDPNFPDTIKIEPRRVSLPKSLEVHFQSYVTSSSLIDLKDLDPALLKRMPFEGFKNLIGHLNGIPVKIKWRNRDGDILSGTKYMHFIQASKWTPTTAAGALALLVGAQKHPKLLASILAIAPEASITALTGPAASVLDAKVAAQVLVTLLFEADGENSRQIAVFGQHIAQAYLGYWAEENGDLLSVALSRLLFEINTCMDATGQTFSLKQRGMLLGFLLAGSMTHALKIKSVDERRLWVINSISNLAWAATTYIGVVPVAGSVISAVAGTISISVVVWAVVANKAGVRDFTPKIREIEGHIEFSALEFTRKNHHHEHITNILEILAWMRATIHMNGLSD